MPDRSPLTPARAAADLCELAADARAVVVLDSKGALAGSSDQDEGRSRELARLAGELLDAVDDALPGEPPAQVEAQVMGGGVYVVREGDWTLAAVARRSALSSLMFYDLRAMLARIAS